MPPAIDGKFWLLKGLSTAFGEATSDHLVHSLGPVPAVLTGLSLFVAMLALQLRLRRYRVFAYWGAVAMVGVFGTMAADVLHVAIGVPYEISTPVFAVSLAAVFLWWYRLEGTLSIHDIDSVRRELFYWAAVVATFALGTALGDMTASSLRLGYFGSLALFAGILAVPCIGYRFFEWDAVLSFWFAYVLTRPLGASLADGLGKPASIGGLGLGSGSVADLFGLLMLALVAYTSASHRRASFRHIQLPPG